MQTGLYGGLPGNSPPSQVVWPNPNPLVYYVALSGVGRLVCDPTCSPSSHPHLLPYPTLLTSSTNHPPYHSPYGEIFR